MLRKPKAMQRALTRNLIHDDFLEKVSNVLHKNERRHSKLIKMRFMNTK